MLRLELVSSVTKWISAQTDMPESHVQTEAGLLQNKLSYVERYNAVRVVDPFKQ